MTHLQTKLNLWSSPVETINNIYAFILIKGGEMIDTIPNEKALELHWYIQIKTRESGPYSYLEVLSMMHNEDLESSNMLTYRGLGGWHQASDFQNFTKANIEAALEENNIDPSDQDDVPFRRSIRIPLSSEVLTIVDDYAFKSECIDLSTGGCLIKLPRGKLKPDSKIKIHFYENGKIQLDAFNISGEVVRVLSAEKLKEGTSYYDLIGIQFEAMKKSEKETLKTKIKEIVLTTMADVTIDRVLNRQSALNAA